MKVALFTSTILNRVKQRVRGHGFGPTKMDALVNFIKRFEIPALWTLVLGAYIATLSGAAAPLVDNGVNERLLERIRQIELRIARIPEEIPTPSTAQALARIERRLIVIEVRLAKLEP
jgi:hypothetical protein